MPSKEPRIGVSRLLAFLALVGQELPHRITLVAAGGTAMTLLKVKRSTRDLDFTGPKADIEIFKRTLRGMPHGMKGGAWQAVRVFSQFLPSYYRRRSRKVRKEGNIDLRALHP